jgi:hypothetical protein
MPLGAYDYQGDIINNVKILQRVSRKPVKYQAKCLDCGYEFPVLHVSLNSGATCPNRRNHGKAAQKVSLALANTATVQEGIRSSNSASAREFHAQEEQSSNGDTVHTQGRKNIRLSAHRDLNFGYFQSAGFSNERDRRSVREFLREENDKAEAAFKAVEDAFKATANALSRERRNAVATGVDSALVIDQDEWDNITAAHELSLAGNDEAIDLLNQNVYERFISFGKHHDWVNSERNLDALTSYCERNLKAHGVNPVIWVPFSVLVKAMARLRLYSLLDEPEHVYHPEPPETENWYAREQREKREEADKETERQTRVGRDPLTGEIREFSKFELKRMSADEYRKAFQVAPTFRDLFIAANEARRG